MVPLEEMSTNELLDYYEIYCARHGRVDPAAHQIESLIPLRNEILRRIRGGWVRARAEDAW